MLLYLQAREYRQERQRAMRFIKLGFTSNKQRGTFVFHKDNLKYVSPDTVYHLAEARAYEVFKGKKETVFVTLIKKG